MINKMIKLFHAESLVHLIIIFIVFAITGSLSVILSEKVENFLRIDKHSIRILGAKETTEAVLSSFEIAIKRVDLKPKRS